MKKGGFFRNVLDTIRSNQATGPSGKGGHGNPNERAIEFGGQLKRSHFSLCQVARHGFPENPTSLAFDPVQKIAAIGTKSGAIRVFGRPGVDVWAQHEPAFAVTHIKFIINQGAIITVTADESIHLWSLRGPSLRLMFSSGVQGASGTSPQANSPAPTPASNISSVSPQSGSSMATAGGAAGLTSTATSTSSFLGQITDTVSGAVDSANDFLIGGVGEHQTTPSPTSDARHSVNRQPELLNTLKFQREHITYIHQTLTSKWLYIGTERGNVHVANVETFELSGYSIAWNKAIELSRKTHPGAIIHISDCPQDTNKLLIGYESGCIVIWDLKQRNAEGRYYHTENLLWLAWHYEGKQFVAAHGDGSLITWQIRSNTRPAQILHPHAKTTSATSSTSGFEHGATATQQQQSLASSFARSLNNELYRPINKVEWKISKSSNEPFYLFSGGLPYDGFDQASAPSSTLDPNRPNTASVGQIQSQTAGLSSSQQLLKASSASPGLPAVSPVSPNWQQDPSSASKVSASGDPRQLRAPKEKSCLRSTSLTVIYGKSLTVLEMDDTIIDFITICDNSPYENDTSDPYAVIVLLSNELILIDLTSSGYPSFDSPYPSASLNESPVTCIQYIADCSSDLIPFLYSTSQNVISRAPKKGFSDKEWPINGGEWGQSMQSYPELVITGHADGTIKFWDMSSVNFDLISKIKTPKLFEKPIKPPNSIFLPYGKSGVASAFSRRSQRPNSPPHATSSDAEQTAPMLTSEQIELSQQVEQDLFAIDKIEFCPITKRLLVAGACAQVIQFRLNKKDPHSNVASSSADTTSIIVDPISSSSHKSISDSEQTAPGPMPTQWRKHCLFKVKSAQGVGASSSSGGSSSSSNSHRGRGLSGFQAELVCLTPSLIASHQSSTDCNQPSSMRAIYCRMPPRVTAIAFQPTHNILAYAHEFGIVLIDIIQKCVIINATLNDLNGGSLISANNQDISIQPFATSSILQHHYQANASAAATAAFSTGNDLRSSGNNNQSSDNSAAGGNSKQQSRADLIDNGRNSGPSTKMDIATNKNSTGASDGSQRETTSPSDSCDEESYDFVQYEKAKVEAVASVTEAPCTNATKNVHATARHSIATTTLQPNSFPVGGSNIPLTNGPISSMFSKFIDKFDSSFRRSRSSSTSSTTGHYQQQPSQPGELGGQQQTASESILCIAFLDPAQVAHSGPHSAGAMGPGQASSLGATSAAANMTNSSSQAGQCGGGANSAALVGGAAASSSPAAAQGPVQSSADPNHKSLSSMDNNQQSGGQLALWLGTSTGSVLLVCLQMPDNEDNRILQLQSISAEPIPQATIKLNGQILCLTPFTCEARLQPLGTPAAGFGSAGSTGTGQMSSSSGIQSQSSSLEGDTLLQSPSSSGSSGSAGANLAAGSGSGGAQGLTGSVAPSSGVGSSRSVALDSPASVSFDSRSSLFIAIVSEKQARVYQVPPGLLNASPSSGPSKSAAGADHHHSSSHHHHHHHHHPHGAAAQALSQLQDSPLGQLLTNKRNLMAECELSGSSYACRSAVVPMRTPDESCLVSYLATGNILVHPLPRLRPHLMEADFVPLTSARISSSMCMSRQGHCLYQPSASEICKFTVSAQYKALVNEMVGLVYVPREMPEMPRTNFFKSLFSVSQSVRQSDRDELFGECSAGKASRGVAKQIGQTAGSTGLDKLKQAAVGTMGHDMRVAREGLDERGEKLSEIEDRTLNMMNSAESYASAAHQLAQKFKDKKWYQF